MAKKKNPMMNQLMKLGVDETIKAIRLAVNNSKNKKNKKKNNNSIRLSQVMAPVAKSMVVKVAKPQINTKKDYIEVSNSELISTSVTAAAAFSVGSSIALNPANSVVFPWLSSVAKNYELYKFSRIKFIYVPFCSTASAGEIMLAFDYDSTDSAPISEQIMSSLKSFSASPVWQSNSVSADLRDMNAFVQWRYVSGASIVGAIDSNDTNAGSFFLASSNGGGGAVGKLYVEYTVQLKSPQLDVAGSSAQSAYGVYLGGAGIATDVPFGTTRTTTFGGSGLLVVAANDSGLKSVIQFNQAGNYMITFTIGGTGLTGAISTSLTSGISIQNVGGFLSGTTVALYTILVKTTSPGADIEIYGIGNTTITNSTLYITSA